VAQVFSAHVCDRRTQEWILETILTEFYNKCLMLWVFLSIALLIKFTVSSNSISAIFVSNLCLFLSEEFPTRHLIGSVFQQGLYHKMCCQKIPSYWIFSDVNNKVSLASQLHWSVYIFFFFFFFSYLKIYLTNFHWRFVFTHALHYIKLRK